MQHNENHIEIENKIDRHEINEIRFMKKTIELHRQLWNYIADETEKQKRVVLKSDAFKHFGWSLDVYAFCWCCEYVKNYSSLHPCSKRCPIKWPGGHCCDDRSPFSDWDACLKRYYTWHDTRDEVIKEAAKAAREIANLPAKED